MEMKVRIRNIEIEEVTSYGFSNVTGEDDRVACCGLIITIAFFAAIFGLYDFIVYIFI